MAEFSVVEATLAELREALESGAVTAEGLLEACLRRIQAYDRSGPCLNAVVELNPQARAEARASDRRRAAGQARGPLDGIPYTAKDSYLVEGMTAAAGSPAFAGLRAHRDAFAVERLKEAGAVCIGLTNMPPMANGGMQRGLYGRAESPYNGEYLTSAFASGSSNGSGTATAASFAAFGLGEETWSSGRAPAALNGLFAYTPSWGQISLRGNWPLVPTMDVVVPHTRSMADLLEVLDVLVVDDAEPRGDFWRLQPWLPLPKASELRPASFPDLAPRSRAEALARLTSLRVGVPRMYTNADPEAGSSEHPGIGGPTGQRILTRESVMDLWKAARQDLEEAGAEVLETDFPAVSNYEGDRPGAPTIRNRGLVPEEFLRREVLDLSAWAWNDFLAANGDPGIPSLESVDGEQIFPRPPGSLPDRYTGFEDDIAAYPEFMRQHPDLDLLGIPTLEEGLRGLQRTRQRDLEEWMEQRGIDVVLFPALADVAPADADTNPDSAEQAWRNGVWVANGNLAIRHLGIPTVTVPLGTMADTGMPAGLTFAGPAFSDVRLLEAAAAFDRLRPRRRAPARTP